MRLVGSLVGGARQAERGWAPRCAGPSGFLAVLAFRGVSLELAALRQERALIRERLRSSAAQRGAHPRSVYRAFWWRDLCARFGEVQIQMREREREWEGALVRA